MKKVKTSNYYGELNMNNEKYLMNKITDLEESVDFYKTAYDIEKEQHDNTIIDRDFYKTKAEALAEDLKKMKLECMRLKAYLVK